MSQLVAKNIDERMRASQQILHPGYNYQNHESPDVLDQSREGLRFGPYLRRSVKLKNSLIRTRQVEHFIICLKANIEQFLGPLRERSTCFTWEGVIFID